MPDALTLSAFVTAVTLGQALLSGSVLISRTQHSHVYRPLAICFFALAVSSVAAIVDAPVFEAWPKAVPHLMAGTSLSADLLILPMFWFYVRGMTSENANVWTRRDWFHLIPAVLGLLVLTVLLFTSNEDRIDLFDSGRDRNSSLQTFLFASIIALYVLWLNQWLFYAVAILKRLLTYRKRLRELFASTEKMELTWVGWLGVLILMDWAWVTGVFALEVFTDIQPVEEPWLSILGLVLVWTIAIWGLRQVPGLATEVAAAKAAEDFAPKYEKSALGTEQMETLAARIEAAMERDKLHRDANLSLSVLAKHVGARPNYVSQTINAALGSHFFDYVNLWRVKDAKTKLASNTDTVLDVAFAVGFNTRSSFYTAFKRHTDMTPTAWRKHNTRT
ncbi:AraC family transcriptional regulator [Erythrobacter sp.]|uniref:helix-turn-helix domain-containing protein n=1 Tax=Sphingomonadales TaxID=204457 RepID=UPI00326340F2